jgi:thymidylate kinase
MTANAEPLVVEFVGAPAAGKSTLSAAVADRLESAGYHCNEPARLIGNRETISRLAVKSWFAAKRLVHAPAWSVFDALAIHRTDQQQDWQMLKLIFNWQFVCSLQSITPDGITLSDQGVFQALWSIGYRSNLNWEDAIRSVTIPESALPDFVVIVKVDVETITGRLGTDHSSKTRVQRSELADIRNSIDGIDHIQELIHDYTNSMQSTGYIEVDNANNEILEPTVKTVSNKIQLIAEAE